MFRKPQSYNPYWVRREVFECYFDDEDNFCNMINQNNNIIHFGYGMFQYTDNGVSIPLYFLEKEDLPAATQDTDLKSAPADAVEWKSAS